MSQKDEATPSYKLIYFDGRCRAETSRLIFVAAGIEFEDLRFQSDEWPKIKPDMPFGQIPVLQIDDKKLGQSHAIEHYLACKYGLAGTTDYEKACVNSLALGLEALIDQSVAIFEEEDDAKRKELLTKYEAARVQYLGYLLDIFKSESKKPGHFVGESLTYADLAFFNFVDIQPSFWASEIDWKPYPDLQKVFDTVKNYPKIKEYLAGRPEKPF